MEWWIAIAATLATVIALVVDAVIAAVRKCDRYWSEKEI